MVKTVVAAIQGSKTFIFPVWGLLLLSLPVRAQLNMEGRVLMDLTGYPVVFELDPGETHTVTRKEGSISRTVKLLSVKLHSEHNLWFGAEGRQANYASADVVVEVGGERITLLHRPYQMPVTVNGLRIYVECIREWNREAGYGGLDNVQKEVRLSACAEDETWGPVSFKFPIKDYRWRSAAYNNTWSSLVPYNKRYYHRGEDYGAIPDRLDVIAPFGGRITASPLPDGDGASNAIFIRNQDGFTCRISHMNTETIKPEYPAGTRVEAGTVLAKTGMTWDGRKAQVHDPHCHIDLRCNDVRLASFPYLMEAYLRDYPDPVLAVAGGYRFALVGEEVILDGSRSLARPGTSVSSWTWKLSDGRKSGGVEARIKYDRPGMYTEELLVKNTDGASDRDFIQVRVYGNEGKDVGRGWAYYSPLREIHVGTPVLFWNRLVNVEAPVIIDFGDGFRSEIDKESVHRYKKPGHYTVTLSAEGPRSEPVTVMLEVIVEE